MASERMRSVADVHLPPIPRDSTPPPGARSDVAPRPQTGSHSLPDLKLPPMPENADAEVAFPPGAFSPEDAIDVQIADLEDWALANERRERTENIRFWVLRGTAFAGTSLAAIEGFLGYGKAAGVLACI